MTASLDAQEIERFRTIVCRRIGLYFDDNRLDLLVELLRRRIAASSTTSAGRYLDRLDSMPAKDAELRLLAAELTVGETYFFRNAEQLRAFSEVVLPALAVESTTRRPRILSAGCASGEEAYSLAILARERMPELAASLSIVGMDVNPLMIDRAVRATYSEWSLRQTSDEMRARYFQRSGKQYALVEPVRLMAQFEERNLFEDDREFWSADSFDVIFARNVIMYFSRDGAQAVLARLAHALRPGGYLFLGHAETLRGTVNDLELQNTHGTFYYRRSASGRSLPLRPVAAYEAQPLFSVAAIEDGWMGAIDRSADRVAELTSDPDRSAVEAREEDGTALDRPAALAAGIGASILEAVSLTNSGKLEEAESACDRLLAADDLRAGARYLKALIAEQRGDLDAAIEQDRIAVALDSSFAMPRLHAGLVARRGGDSRLAQRELELALALLADEDEGRILLFGGGFGRESLLELCRAALASLGAND